MAELCRRLVEFGLGLGWLIGTYPSPGCQHSQVAIPRRDLAAHIGGLSGGLVVVAQKVRIPCRKVSETSLLRAGLVCTKRYKV